MPESAPGSKNFLKSVVCVETRIYSLGRRRRRRAPKKRHSTAVEPMEPHPCRVTNILYRHRCDHRRASYGALVDGCTGRTIGGYMYVSSTIKCDHKGDPKYDVPLFDVNWE